MAYFVKEGLQGGQANRPWGLADFAITEDSDLIAFGCPRIVAKMNYAGYGDVFDIPQFRSETNNTENGWNEQLRIFQSMSEDEFLTACIMAGCEYIESIERVGLKRVLNDYKKAKSCEQVIIDLKANKAFKDRVPENYI